MEGIIRPMNETDKQYIEVELNSKRKKSYLVTFTEELNRQEKQATINKKPFARHAAREDFTTQIDSEKKRQLREYGEIREAIEIPKLDWNKYSDLKNFEVVSENEVPDPDISKRNPGLNVSFKSTKYKFKGYSNLYRVMEDEASAVKRAQDKVIASRK